MEQPEKRDYWEAVEIFLKELQPLSVQAVAMVALTADEDVHDVVSIYGAGPFELASMAGILQMHAGYQYSQLNDDDEEDDEADEEDDDEI
jgi:hypothetical protein